MSDAPTIEWTGKSGTKYKYWIYDIKTTFTEGPGNYMFAKKSPEGHYPIYIGETNDLSTRLPSHEKRESAISNGATHVHIHGNTNGQQARRVEEADLVDRWHPVCNG